MVNRPERPESGRENPKEELRMPPSGRRKEALTYLLSAGLATVVTLLGWVAMHYPASHKTIGWIRFVAVLLEFPGAVGAALAAMIFSPQGVHGLDDFAWMISPLNWMADFVFFSWLFLRRSRSQR